MNFFTQCQGVLITCRYKKISLARDVFCDPTGIRTPVTEMKARCPRPLDDGASSQHDMLSFILRIHLKFQTLIGRSSSKSHK